MQRFHITGYTGKITFHELNACDTAAANTSSARSEVAQSWWHADDW